MSISLDDLLWLAAFDAGPVVGLIHAEGRTVRDELWQFQLSLVRKESVVQFPELALFRGAQRRDRSVVCIRMNALEGELAKGVLSLP